jgi:methionyl-tRNA synthetase
MGREAFFSVQHRIGEAMRIGAILAQPFMPIKSANMLEALGVEGGRRSMFYAKWGADYCYGQKKEGKEGRSLTHIFPRPSDEGSEAEGENMQEVMQRKKAEKEAKKAEQRIGAVGLTKAEGLSA